MCVQSQESIQCQAFLQPYGMVSLLDMLLEKSEYFVSIGRMFEANMYGIYGATRPDAPLRSQDFKKLLIQWGELRDKCKEMEMYRAADATSQAIAHFEKFEGQITYGAVISRSGELYRAFTGELSTQKFLILMPGRSKYFAIADLGGDEPPPFGQEVADVFPDAAYDIREAGRCLAMERDTACVLHLMRVLEVGLQRLAVKFNVTFERENWNKIIDQIESRIRQMSTNSPKPANWKDAEERYARVAKEFRYLKDAWRNNAAHARSRYDFEEAQTIYRHDREFMCELALNLGAG